MWRSFFLGCNLQPRLQLWSRHYCGAHAKGVSLLTPHYCDLAVLPIHHGKSRSSSGKPAARILPRINPSLRCIPITVTSHALLY